MNRVLGWALTYRLWRALWGRVPGHPLMAVIKQRRAKSGDTGCSPVLIGVLLLLSLPVMWIIGFGLALMAIVGGGTVRGMFAAALTARAIFQERDRRRLDLLGMTPAGLLGTGWVLALREFRLTYAGQFANRYIHNAQRIIGIAAICMTALITFGTLAFQFEGVADLDGEGVTPALDYILGALQVVFAVLIWLFTDNAQSPLIGALVGIWTGLRARRKPEAAGTSAALYAIVQLSLMMPAILIWFTAYTIPEGLRLVMVIVLMCVAREIVLRVIWSVICRDLNANGTELPAVLRL